MARALAAAVISHFNLDDDSKVSGPASGTLVVKMEVLLLPKAWNDFSGPPCENPSLQLPGSIIIESAQGKKKEGIELALHLTNIRGETSKADDSWKSIEANFDDLIKKRNSCPISDQPMFNVQMIMVYNGSRSPAPHAFRQYPTNYVITRGSINAFKSGEFCSCLGELQAALPKRPTLAQAAKYANGLIIVCCSPDQSLDLSMPTSKGMLKIGSAYEHAWTLTKRA